MTTLATKHRRRGPDQQTGCRVGAKGAILDDMDTQPTAEMPLRRSKVTTEGHSVLFGSSNDKSNFRSLKDQDFCSKKQSADDRLKAQQEQAGRVHDMNTKHFVFGHHPQTMQSELRGSLLPPTRDVLMNSSKEIRPIGGRNNKGASNLFISARDRQEWGASVSSTSRESFGFDSKTHCKSEEVMRKTMQHIKTMRASHFTVGNDRDDWSSTARADFAQPGVTERVQPIPIKESSVPLDCAPGQRRRPSEFVSMNRGQYGSASPEPHQSPARQKLPQVEELRRTNMVFGYDAREFRTENKGNFKRPQYVSGSPGKGGVAG